MYVGMSVHKCVAVCTSVVMSVCVFFITFITNTLTLVVKSERV